MEVTTESIYEPETTDEAVVQETESDEMLETADELETDSESSEEDPVSVSENTVETEMDPDSDEPATVIYESDLYSDMMSGADTEAIVLAINQQTEIIKHGNAAICAVLGLLIGIVFVQGFRLKRV